MSDGKKTDNDTNKEPLDPTDFDFDFDADAPAGDAPGSDFDFDFEDLPSPEGNSPVKSESAVAFETPIDDGGFGDADDAFEETEVAENDAFGGIDDSSFGGDGEPVDDAFGSGELLPDEDVEEEVVSDFGEVDGVVVEEEIAIDDGGSFETDEEVEVEYVSDDIDNRTFLQKHMFNMILGGVGVFMVAMAWVTLSPMLFTSAPISQNIQTSTQGSPLDMPSGPVDFDQPETNTGIPAFLPTENDQPTGNSVFDPIPVSTETPLDFPAPETTTAVLSTEDSARITSLEGEVSLLMSEVSALVAKIEALEARGIPQPPAVPEPVVVAQDKPLVIEEWVLRGVQGNVAWVENTSGEFVEVQVGHELAQAGRVTAIQLYEGDWLVVTTEGVILQD